MIDYLSFFKNLPPEIGTMFIASMPVGELRASLPFALGVYKLSIPSAYFWSVIGNVLPVIFIVWLLEPASKFLIQRSKTAAKFFNWVFERTKYKFEGKYLKYGQYALILFVAIPFPITGAWSGSIAAFIFGIPRLKSFYFISIGILISGLIVTLLYTGVLSIVT